MKKNHLLPLAVLVTACSATLTITSEAQVDLPAVAEPAATAVDATDGKIINSVNVRMSGSGKVDKARILSRMSLQAGQPYSKDREEADIKNLVDSGDAENVSITSTPAGGGVNVVVTVEARAGLGDITFVGNSLIATTKLRTVVEEFKIATPENLQKVAEEADVVLIALSD